jgi:gamma-butyrobetaine dioxygenase
VDHVDLLGPLRGRGSDAYLGEPVTQLEHALQAAALASAGGAPLSLVLAALLHDVGWLVGGSDGDHAAAGAAFVEPLGADVAEPIRLHVEAKRWLCTTSPGYRDRLSTASERTLQLQGGLLDPDGVRAFESSRHAEAALALRRWDDDAKVPGLHVAPLSDYEHLLRTAR